MPPHLAFVVAEEERAIGNDRRAERQTELVLMKHVGVRRVQHRSRAQPVVHAEVVERSVAAIRPGLGDDVHEAAERAAVFGQVGRVQHAKFLGGFLRRRRARQAGEGLHVVGAVDLNHRVQLGLSGEGQPRRRGGADADVGFLERSAADVLAPARHPARQLHEVDEIAAADRQRFDFLRGHDAAQLRFGRLDERGVGGNAYLLGNRTEAHPNVRVGRAADRQHDAAANRGLEVGELGAQLVLAGIERRQPVAAFCVARGRAGRARGDVSRRQRDAGQRCARFVADRPEHARRGDLRGGVRRAAEREHGEPRRCEQRPGPDRSAQHRHTPSMTR